MCVDPAGWVKSAGADVRPLPLLAIHPADVSESALATAAARDSFRHYLRGGRAHPAAPFLWLGV